VAHVAKAEADCAALGWSGRLLPGGLSDGRTRVAEAAQIEAAVSPRATSSAFVQHALRRVSGNLIRQRRAEHCQAKGGEGGT
jgi:hypothetical protein